MNAKSSRSHSIFCITVHQKETHVAGEELLKTGKLYLVDLAGSENIGRSGAVEDRAREAGAINQSLLTLGRVISKLVEREKHVPYRESKLTRMLQDSLGGRTKTSMIATVSPAAINSEESQSTMDYAARAKNILNRPEVNAKLTKKALIKEYTDEIDRLRKDLVAAREKNGVFVSAERFDGMEAEIEEQKRHIEEMEEQLKTTVAEMTKATKLFEEKAAALEKTEAELHETEAARCAAAQARDEFEFVANERAATEESLARQATDLVEVSTEATDHVGRLHAKVDRALKTVQTNSQGAGTFATDMHSQLAAMHAAMGAFAAEQAQFFAGIAPALAGAPLGPAVDYSTTGAGYAPTVRRTAVGEFGRALAGAAVEQRDSAAAAHARVSAFVAEQAERTRAFAAAHAAELQTLGARIRAEAEAREAEAAAQREQLAAATAAREAAARQQMQELQQSVAGLMAGFLDTRIAAAAEHAAELDDRIATASAAGVAEARAVADGLAATEEATDAFGAASAAAAGEHAAAVDADFAGLHGVATAGAAAIGAAASRSATAAEEATSAAIAGLAGAQASVASFRLSEVRKTGETPDRRPWKFPLQRELTRTEEQCALLERYHTQLELSAKNTGAEAAPESKEASGTVTAKRPLGTVNQ